jgi:HSP20 family protein
MTNQTEAPGEKSETPQAVTSPRPRFPGFPDLFDEMDRLWGTYIPAPWRFRTAGGQRIMPALDIFEKDGKLHINAELPGMNDKDIEIEVTDDALTISGEKRDEREVKEDNYYRTERSYGRFRRQVALPPGADTDHVAAAFKDGVLKIEVPVKAPTTTVKKIAVKQD